MNYAPQMENVNLRGVHYFVNIYQFNQSCLLLCQTAVGGKRFKSLYHSFKLCPFELHCVPRNLPPNSFLPSVNSITTQSSGGYRNGRNRTQRGWQTVILQSKLNLESNSMHRFDVCVSDLLLKLTCRKQNCK